jgi:hypothetical protein
VEYEDLMFSTAGLSVAIKQLRTVGTVYNIPDKVDEVVNIAERFGDIRFVMTSLIKKEHVLRQTLGC